MKITLRANTNINIAQEAIRTAWASQDKSDTVEAIEKWLDEGMTTHKPEIGPNDAALIERVGNKFKHASTLEHVSYTFNVEGVSRALLQELARHRIASYTVKSTRYTLKELKTEKPFIIQVEAGTVYSDRAKRYLVMTGIDIVDVASIKALENLREVLVSGVSNDRAKFCLPESYKTTVFWTINMRSLQNFLKLRSDKGALWEIREMAQKVYAELPTQHRYMFDDFMYDEEALRLRNEEKKTALVVLKENLSELEYDMVLDLMK